MKPLDGSSQGNPWVLDERGNLALASMFTTFFCRTLRSHALPQTVLPKKNWIGRRAKGQTSLVRHTAVWVLRAKATLALDPRLIFQGPPSTINEFTRVIGAAPVHSVTAPGANPVVNPAAHDMIARSITAPVANSPEHDILARYTPSSFVSGSISALQAPVAETARRTKRDRPLTSEDLYLDDERPPVLAAPKPHHVCGLCADVKSHPVSYAFIPYLRAWADECSGMSVATVIATFASGCTSSAGGLVYV